MADPHGFMKVPKVEAAKRPVDERVGDWHEVYERQNPHERAGEVSQQARRCMDCGIPFCHSGTAGCPLGQPHPGMERPGAAWPVGRRQRPVARHQQLPGVHRPAVSRAVRGRVRAVDRRGEDRRQRHDQADRTDHRRPGLDGRHRRTAARGHLDRARASRSSAPDPRDWLPHNNSPAPDITSRCMSATTDWAA